MSGGYARTGVPIGTTASLPAHHGPCREDKIEEAQEFALPDLCESRKLPQPVRPLLPKNAETLAATFNVFHDFTIDCVEISPPKPRNTQSAFVRWSAMRLLTLQAR